MAHSDESRLQRSGIASTIAREDDMKLIARALSAAFVATLLLAPSLAHALEAEIRLRTDGSQTPTIIGATNLPDETKLLVTLRRMAINYNAQLNVTVQAGQFVTERFSDDGKALPPGDYAVEVSMASAEVQPAKVQTLIGPKGEKLSGPLIEQTKFGIIVRRESTINVSGSASTASDAAAKK